MILIIRDLEISTIIILNNSRSLKKKIIFGIANNFNQYGTAHAQLTRGRQEALISGPENQ